MGDRGPYGPGQSLASMNRPDDATVPVNLAAIAYELRTANLLAARHISRLTEDPKDLYSLERLS